MAVAPMRYPWGHRPLLWPNIAHPNTTRFHAEGGGLRAFFRRFGGLRGEGVGGGGWVVVGFQNFVFGELLVILDCLYYLISWCMGVSDTALLHRLCRGFRGT